MQCTSKVYSFSKKMVVNELMMKWNWIIHKYDCACLPSSLVVIGLWASDRYCLSRVWSRCQGFEVLEMMRKWNLSAKCLTKGWRLHLWLVLKELTAVVLIEDLCQRNASERLGELLQIWALSFWSVDCFGGLTLLHILLNIKIITLIYDKGYNKWFMQCVNFIVLWHILYKLYADLHDDGWWTWWGGLILTSFK